MTAVCEHEFETPDSENPKYSSIEYDLYADTGLSIRKNLETGRYEIFKIGSGIVVFSGTLRQVVDEANNIEGEENTTIECKTISCPKVRDRWKS